uniref:Uncharacterized protein n=1 Tax=Timema cristinae TaxID=61476 RepID=A0A7R9H116_TIMCR|nr:unnamed protein product [Timema cristinae]
MADPSIQTFCCHQPNNPDSVVNIMKEFNSEAYNTVCLVSSSIGIVGAVYQVFLFALHFGLTILKTQCPLLMALGMRSFVHSLHSPVASLVLTDSSQLTSDSFKKLPDHITYPYAKPDDLQKHVFRAVTSDSQYLANKLLTNLSPMSSTLLVSLTFTVHVSTVCVTMGTKYTLYNTYVHFKAWIQYFYTVTWFWTLCYALDMRLLLKDKPGYPHWYHMTSWLVPALLTSLGLTILYLPDADCHDIMSLGGVLLRILPNYCATYLPMLAVMLINPVLYVLSSRDVELIIVRYLSQFTDKERSMVDSVRIKFSLINVVFYICWLPNLINGILLWTLWFNLPVNIIIGLWYIMAVLNPLQALFNSLVYRRWSGATERVYIPFRKLQADDPSMDSSTPPLELASETTGEDTPLLQSREFSHRRLPRAPINGSSGSF